MSCKAPATRLCVVAAIILFSTFAAAEQPASVRDGPAGYTMACAIHETGGVLDLRRCVELGAAQRCEHEAQMASLSSHETTSMTILNRSDEPIKVYWLTFTGLRRLYHAIAPGDRVVQSTFLGHNWLVTNQRGECIGIYNAAPISIAFF
jgi:hypothetical protein